MINYQTISQFKRKDVGILYDDSGKEMFARGVIADISERDVTLLTNKNILIISLDSIKKVKIGKDELDERRE